MVSWSHSFMTICKLQRVSGRSPEWTAKGAQRPSEQALDVRRRTYIQHPVLGIDALFAVNLQ